ncbi:hypothetical protein STRDD11_01119 [Streptococcus sp. DD11]|uniref:Blp family class II bacteriocin n=1 Tax=Streptococcus sp. DD11 TaxID=1777879 RepID=UPI00079B0586|nr:Blp family class II bacteriocin [Streptococcus sp. DD11]KXT84073.1 hypothetical protein STRDD11_01119 [Streptococcus sp. DD11]
MTTKTISQFDVMDENMLAAVEGGGVDWGKAVSCAGSIAMGAMEGYGMAAGSTIYLGPFAIGTGAVGGIIGGIGGAFYCG